MKGTACCFNQFWSKKEQNVRFQTNFKEKTLKIERQFFQNVAVFYVSHTVFFTGFWTKKEQKVRFQTDIKENTLIIEQKLFQNVTVFNDWYILFFRCFLVGVIFTTFELLVKLFP